MTDLGVEYAALSRAAATITAVHDQLTTDGQGLDDRAPAFLGDGWRGDAATSFHDGYDEWVAGRHEVLASLATIGRLVDEANRRFEVRNGTEITNGGLNATPR